MATQAEGGTTGGMSSAKRIRMELEASGAIAPSTPPMCAAARRRSSVSRVLEAKRALFIFDHGLGDHVQFTGAIREVMRQCPNLDITVRPEPAFAELFRGLCRTTTATTGEYDLIYNVEWLPRDRGREGVPSKAGEFIYTSLGLENTWKNFPYEVAAPSTADAAWAEATLSRAGKGPDGRHKAVLIQHAGKSLPGLKDIPNDTAKALIDWLLERGFAPVVCGVKHSPLCDIEGVVRYADRNPMRWLALAERAAAVFGIDSGPTHLALCTSTPTIVVWTGHHPVQYCPPTGNATHLVPDNAPAFSSRLQDGFRIERYEDLHESLLGAATRLLAPGEIAKRTQHEITLNVPQGAGDIIWIWQKFSLYFKRINFNIFSIEDTAVERRSIDWLKILPRVGTVRMLRLPKHEYEARLPKTTRRVLDVIRDWRATGKPQDYSCNTALDEGRHLGSLDSGKVNWDVPLKAAPHGVPYERPIVIAISGSTGSVKGTWTPERWVDFIDLVYERFQLGNPIVLIGAEFDRHVVETVEAMLARKGYERTSMIGRPPAEVVQLIKDAAYFIGYQSGLNVIAAHTGTPQLIVYFDWLDKMKDSWAKPGTAADGTFTWGTFGEGIEAIVARMRAPDHPKPPQGRRRNDRRVWTPAMLGGWKHAIHFVVPAGIGDISWIYSKIMHLKHHTGRDIIFSVAGADYRRAEQFVQMLPGVKWGGYIDGLDSWRVLSQSLPPDWTDSMGWGFPIKEYMQNLAANVHLEMGRKLADWWPRLPTNYHYPLDIPLNDREIAKQIANRLPAPLLCVYVSGHNGWRLWGQDDWVEFLKGVIDTRQLHGAGMVFVGDTADQRETEAVAGAMSRHGVKVETCIAKPLGVALSLIERSNYFFGYPSGLSILANVLGTPALMLLPHLLKNLAETFADPVCLAIQRYRCMVDPPPREALEWFRRAGLPYLFNHD